MNIPESTSLYERWLAQQTHVLPADLKRKHQFMAEALFPFFRATFYRWLQLWPKTCKNLQLAPPVLAIGDLHVENYGTWRDLEGRLVWGVNDFDQAANLPYAQDLVRLATSALLAVDEQHIALKPRIACERILEGYTDSLKNGGEPFVLAEKNRFLRDIAQQQLRDPQLFWNRLLSWPAVPKKRVPADAVAALEKALPHPLPAYRIVARQSGLGSRGLPRFAALCNFQGGLISREAKAIAPSAVGWLDPRKRAPVLIGEIVQRAVRDHDWTFKVEGAWQIRRLAPDCTKIRMADMPAKRNEERILFSMGWETANVHLGSATRIPAVVADLKKRKADWLFDAAREMAVAVRKDWKSWRSEFEG